MIKPSQSNPDFKEHINMNGGRLTKQRRIITRYLQGVTNHPSAETVYKEVKKQIPNISLGTVYRNLKYLAERGFILQLIESDRARFDGNNTYHLHFICTQCNTIRDIWDTDAIPLKGLNKFGEIKKIECNMYGVCKKCKLPHPKISCVGKDKIIKTIPAHSRGEMSYA